MVGTDIFTGKKVQDICPASHNMTKPVVSTKTYTVLDVTDDDFCSLMDADGNTREDIPCPNMDSPDPKLGEQIREGLEAEKEVAAVVTSAMGQDAITNVKFIEDEA
jgi:translation initiation factor 5A